jgi:ABC-2 type transport system ATP-binding protein
MIKVNNVSKYFDDFKVLDDISMNVRKGTIYGLVGANGAGKTTILNHISGAYRPDAGGILVDGISVWENDDIKQRVITIADDWYFYPTYTVKQMAMFYKSKKNRFLVKRTIFYFCDEIVVNIFYISVPLYYNLYLTPQVVRL